MRDLKECQAEVFRRSEKRIQQRKQRQRMLVTFCLPMVLCAAALFLLFWKQPSKQHPAGPGMGEQFSEEFFAEAAESVQISGSGFSVTHTDPHRISRIASLLQQYETPTGGTDKEPQKSETLPPTDRPSDKQGTAAAYTVVYVSRDGSQHRYILTENVLTNQTGEDLLLTPEQVQELKEVLGIPSR